MPDLPPALPSGAVDPDEEAIDFRFNQAPSERLFDALRDLYAEFGGIAWSESLQTRLDEGRPGPPDCGVAHMIAAGDLFHFEWRGARWIPMIQFRAADLSLDPAIGQVRRELGRSVDGWEVASWLVQPNDWLQRARPIDLIDRDLPQVLEAARADRFVGTGC